MIMGRWFNIWNQRLDLDNMIYIKCIPLSIITLGLTDFYDISLHFKKIYWIHMVLIGYITEGKYRITQTFRFK